MNQRLRGFIPLFFIFILGVNLTYSFYDRAWAGELSISDHLQQHVKSLQGGSADAIASYYSKRDHKPIWVQKYQVNESGKELLRELSNAARQGLDPQDYGIDEVQWLNRTAGLYSESDHIVQAEVLGKLEVALTRNFVKFIDHLTGGRITPQAVNGKWFLEDTRPKLMTILSDVVEHGVSKTLASIAQGHNGYAPLLEALASYRSIQERGGWTSIPKGSLLGRGMQGKRVAVLQHRLALTGDLQGDFEKKNFNEDVEKAVRQFQRRHGLTEDGLVGPKTLFELNVSVKMRIKQILVNLERRRWMPRELGDNHVYVNIPDFMLAAYLNREKRMEMRVIVGKPMSQTPIFSDMIDYIVFNPYWYVPRSIATDEILPKFLEDPLYLETKNYEIVDWDEQILEFDLLTEDNLKNGEVRIRQKPGPSNALGLVKFMFPNDHAVYLHDTPSDYLFEESERDFSHGCIRVQDPRAFAELLLEESLTPEEIAEIFKVSEREIVDMPQSVPVYIVYFTTWVDNEGLVNFREDIYGHDERLWKALKPVLSDTVARPQNAKRWIYGLTNERPVDHLPLHIAKE